jgi:hypothetical protein
VSRPRSAGGARRWLPLLAIAATGIALYWNGLEAPFLWDDDPAIVDNRTIRTLLPLPGPLAPPLETPMAGRPIVNLSLALNYASGALDVTGYHWWNLVVHISCALLLYGIVRRTLEGPRLRERFGPVATPLALLSSIVWMVHPLQTEAVDYVTQRTESMMALFLLVALHAAIRSAGSSRPGRAGDRVHRARHGEQGHDGRGARHRPAIRPHVPVRVRP